MASKKPPVIRTKSGPIDKQGAAVQPFSQSSTPGYAKDVTVLSMTGRAWSEPGYIVKVIKEGLPFKAFDRLKDSLNVSQNELASLLGIPISTLNRRRHQQRFHQCESDRLVRFAKVKDLALELMQGDNDQANEWLTTPQATFENESPLLHSATEIGAREVEDLILRIRHGVFN